MKNEQYPLTRDPRWDNWTINSIEYFEKLSSRLGFHPGVSQEVTQRFEVVRKLLLHSFFVYDFLDVALERSLLTLELALKQRHFELTGFEKSGLSKLIKWGAKEWLFEDDEEVIHCLRRIRNQIAHPNSYQLLGHLSLDLIFRIVEIINDLYEDVELRKARKDQEKQTNNRLEEFVKDGAILELSNQRLIIFKAVMLYCNNKIAPTIYHFLFWPIFDTEVRNKAIDVCEPIVIGCNSWEVKNDVITFLDNSSGKIKLTPIDKAENRLKYANWKKSFEASTFPLSFWISSRIGELKIQCGQNRGLQIKQGLNETSK